MGLHRRTFLRRVAQGMGAIAIATGSKTLLTACAGNVDSTSGTSTTGTVSSKGLLNPGTLAWGAEAISGAPYVFYDPVDPGKLIGFEVEIADAIAQLMGVNAVFVATAYDQLSAALAANRFDMILNGWEITTDRDRTQLFSQPYYRYGQQIVVRANDPRFEQYTATSEVTLANLAGMTVGTGIGYKAQEILERDKNIKTRAYDGNLPFDDLAQGRIDAVMLDYPIVAYYVLGAGPGGTVNNSLRPIGVPIFLNNYVIAFNKNNPKGETLKTEVDQAIDILKKDGTLRRIYEKWKMWNDQQTQIGIV
ncbi:ABC transporter substrate-binding protein [Thermosynechococcus sp. QKsg1]|uniref:ABC transporter substrate-binding protein n=1 Tax=unclassified Thermosynechococcus TaxID=2622553 RepID=UPI00122E43D8|nr:MULTISPECIES: ABC transporter substrate-binding protein [unclassified Thermosynechococcus]QEQ01959.1 amino acid ABC transporter substrate-binding protein [Thermosynechococcus sp. CL-1]WJI23841.1 ABC transporter substrate-binding protein [Thermosynechococcus sp. B0]WJI26354.1 ABC transporter substrate-binding protein [Thermosynechococcus sp. B1]WJI28881.1 ABC transporter substrate-binding protein [Thermosynechococcus sp. B3]WKT83474.1 ABC transporter substrate-binding protein [Thermosynechoc